MGGMLDNFFKYLKYQKNVAENCNSFEFVCECMLEKRRLCACKRKEVVFQKNSLFYKAGIVLMKDIARQFNKHHEIIDEMERYTLIPKEIFSNLLIFQSEILRCSECMTFAPREYFTSIGKCRRCCVFVCSFFEVGALP
jgi:hypothetical protein